MITLQPSTAPEYVSMAQLLKLLRSRGICNSANTVKRLESAGEFPKRIYFSERCVRWCTAEVMAWSEARAVARNPFISPKAS